MATLLEIHNGKTTVPLIDGKNRLKIQRILDLMVHNSIETCKIAASSIELLPGKHTVAKNLISNDEVARIDFGADYQAVRAAEGN